MVQMVAAAAWWSAAAWPALCRACGGPCGCCGARARDRGRLGSGRAVILWSGPRRPAVLKACDPSIVEWAVLATTAMVQDVWRLYPCVRDVIRTYMCGSCSGVDAVAIAVDRKTLKGGVAACTRFTSVRPQYYPTALLAITERPRTEQWMDPKGRERYMIYSRRQR